MFGALTSPCVLVLGLGASGQSMARWCLRHGATLRWADTRENPPKLTLLREKFADEFGSAFAEITFHTGALDEGLLQGVDIVGISPGLSPYLEPLQGFIETARQRGIAVWSDIEFFGQALQALRISQSYAPRCVGITGTNGKTTVTSLCAFLAQRSGLNAVAAGNISPPALDVLLEALDQQTLPDFWALELSSFQLDNTTHLSLDAAVVLNVTEDHLDWHPSFEAYAQAKGRIYAHAAVAVANRADAQSMQLAGERAVTFGLDAPRQARDWGVLQDNGLRWLALAEDDEPTPKKKRGAATVLSSPHFSKLMPAEALRLVGEHNVENVLAALALVTEAGIPLAKTLHALRDYRGLPHRVEFVRQVQGVDYIDDSKGTNVGATVAALNGLRRRVILLAGGEGKGQNFAPLLTPVRQWARAVLLIGRDATRLQAALESSDVPLETMPTLEAAVQRAATLAQPGDAVLLSPACASFDMFRDYEHRAEVFVHAVHQLALAHGEVV